MGNEHVLKIDSSDSYAILWTKTIELYMNSVVCEQYLNKIICFLNNKKKHCFRGKYFPGQYQPLLDLKTPESVIRLMIRQLRVLSPWPISSSSDCIL